MPRRSELVVTAIFGRRSRRALVSGLAAAFAGLTCDSPTALEDPGSREVVLSWDGDSVLVAGTTAPLRVSVLVDGAEYPAARFRITSADTSIVAVAPDGLSLEGRRMGSATVTAELLSSVLPAGTGLSRTVTVGPKAVYLTGVTDTLRSLGDTLRLRLVAVDGRDQERDEGLTATWSSSDTTIASVSGTGLVTARADGAVEITADMGTRAAAVGVHVRQRAARLVLSTTVLRFDALGADSTVTATAVDARGTALLAAPALTWESSAPTVATVQSGRVTAAENGSAWVRVRAGGVGDSVRVDVAQRAAQVVIETAGPVSLRSIGETAALRARAYDPRGNEVRSTLPLWRSLAQHVVHVDQRTGLATAISPGVTQVLAELDGASAQVGVSVQNVPASLEIVPAAVALTSVGDTVPLRVVARNGLGVVIPDFVATWRGTDAQVATVLADGRVVGLAVGAARAIAEGGGLADTALVTVSNHADAVDIIPTSATLASIGDTIVPDVRVTNARGMLLDRTAVSWWSDDPGVARVTAAGVVIATGPGETIVRAASPTFPDRRDAMVVTVTNAPATVTIERQADTLTAVGRTRAYSVEVRNARGALLNVLASWRSADQSIASVSGSGIVTALAPGLARVIASAGGVADTLYVTVRDDVVSLEVGPSSATIGSVGDTLRLSALARNALGGIVATPALTWTSTDTFVVSALADGRAVARGAGTARVIAVNGTLADTAVLTVTNSPVFVDFARAADTLLAIGDSVIPAITIRNARGDLLARTTVTWSSDDPVVARVSTGGVVTARDTGSTWVRASGVGARDSIRIVVRNAPTSIVVSLASDGTNASVDTMSASGQTLAYMATVRNRVGAPIAGATVEWRSTSPSATVSGSGVVTAIGFGTALVIARAGTVEDTVRIVVADLRRIYVDNAVVPAARFGTSARPYAAIQDGVNAAGVDDTVIVRRGNGYSESVTLGRRITLLGDSAAFVAGGRNPLLLPQLHHDLGAAGITAAAGGSSYAIRYLGIQHSVDGEAIVIRDADNAYVEHVHVNPNPSFRTGRGILVEGTTGSVLVARSTVDSVYGFGVRVRNAANVRVEGVTVRGVGARTGYSGAGIELAGGSGGTVTGAVVRRTAGPQVLFDGTSSAELLASTLTGEQQLVRLSALTGATIVRGNTFDMRRQAGDPMWPRGGGLPDPSGLEVLASGGVLVEDNTFVDVDGRTSTMDAVRLAAVRAVQGSPYGATLVANRFRGGRTGVRSEGAHWRMTGARADSVGTVVSVAAADTVVLDADTLVNSRTAAVHSLAAGARLTISGSTITGAQRAIVTSGGTASVVVRGNTVLGTGSAATAQPMTGALDLDAANVELVGNTIRSVRSFAAVVVRGGVARVDSNFVSRNLVGVRLGVLTALTMRHNGLMDNDTLPNGSPRAVVGVVNDVVTPRIVGANWWGDLRGPRRAGRTAPTAGDSVVGSVVYDSLAAPIGAHQGAGTVVSLVEAYGDGQTGALQQPLLLPLAVRAVDASGKPIAGAAVTFRIGSNDGEIVGGARVGGDHQRVVTTNADGVAEASVFGSKRGTLTVTTSSGSASLNFSFLIP